MTFTCCFGHLNGGLSMIGMKKCLPKEKTDSRYDLEAHLVHIKEGMDVAKAKEEMDGLLVLGMFFKREDDYEHPFIKV